MTHRISRLGAAILLSAGIASLSLPGAADAANISSSPDKFGRMFILPPFALPNNAVSNALMEVGKAGGIMDAKDNLAAGPIALIVDPTLNTVNINNTQHTAGTTFVGQFMDHDMTFDIASSLGKPTVVLTSPNGRTPDFDLDSVYGGGFIGSPQLYEEADRAKFRIESGGQFEDLPREALTNTAIISDPRNDENMMISGLQVAFLRFHNAMVDRLRADSPNISTADVFDAARRLTTYHYQWMIVHEFLPQFVGQDMVDDILENGRRFYVPDPGEAYIPVEFQIAYRFGHSMVRPSYRANLAGDNGAAFFGLVFDPAGEGSADPVDLRGKARAPRRFIGWQTFFDFGDGEVKPNKIIDTKISTPLFNLPLITLPDGTPPTSLMQRNLLRHLTWTLPSGQAIARAMGVAPLASSNFADIGAIRSSFATSTPLFFYVLREGEVQEAGLHLGQVGGRIVGEVILGLLQADPDAYLNAQPDFLPSVPTRAGVSTGFKMADFLTFAGVDPDSRGQ
jgi:hypothetical protein